jgi:hypothetical protein
MVHGGKGGAIHPPIQIRAIVIGNAGVKDLRPSPAGCWRSLRRYADHVERLLGDFSTL